MRTAGELLSVCQLHRGHAAAEEQEIGHLAHQLYKLTEQEIKMLEKNI